MIRLQYVPYFRGGRHECLVAFLVVNADASYALDHETILNYQDDRDCLCAFVCKWRDHAVALGLPFEPGPRVSNLLTPG